jgi:hypothetical protein
MSASMPTSSCTCPASMTGCPSPAATQDTI